MTENAESAGAILLAGGASERLGGHPKALVPVGSEPAVVRMSRICSESGIHPIVVVTGVHGAAVREALEGSGVILVDNPSWADGRTGSVQAGLAAVECDEVVLWPVDHPFVRADTLSALARALKRDALALWATPVFDGHGGHPVRFRRDVVPRVQELLPNQPLNRIPRELGPQVVRVPVTDPGVRETVETWESYAQGLKGWVERGEP